jgi:hypothetical protein
LMNEQDQESMYGLDARPQDMSQLNREDMAV